MVQKINLKNILLIQILIFLNLGNELFAANLADIKGAERDSSVQAFWSSLQHLCGQSFKGEIMAAAQNDTTFAGKELIMHVRKCDNDNIRIPFFVGDDRSRTWVVTLTSSGILLKHDHRHKDGSADKVTMYGGHTTNNGDRNKQVFPADLETAHMLPAAIGNVWWIEVYPGKKFMYNLRRVNTDRLFSVSFDLSKPIENPGQPWGIE